MNEILNLENISVNFGGHIAVNEVSLTIDPGTITGLIGPNGAGKTTLFNVISGLLAPSSGRVLFADRDITSLAPHKRARIGIGRTFQRLELFNSLTVIDNLRVSIETSNQWKTSREAMSGSSMNAKINKNKGTK